MGIDIGTVLSRSEVEVLFDVKELSAKQPDSAREANCQTSSVVCASISSDCSSRHQTIVTSLREKETFSRQGTLRG